jgi:hypothetical protein
MIFHGVYTTPQIIDSTVTISSNNAVSSKAVATYVLGEIANTEAKIVDEIRDEESTDHMTSPKAVVDYVNTKLENVGGGGKELIYTTDAIEPSSPFTIHNTRGIIFGNSVRMYIQIRAQTNMGTYGDAFVVGNLKTHVPSPESNVSVVFPWNKDLPVTLNTSGQLLLQFPAHEIMSEGTTVSGIIEYGDELDTTINTRFGDVQLQTVSEYVDGRLGNLENTTVAQYAVDKVGPTPIQVSYLLSAHTNWGGSASATIMNHFI